MILRMVKKSFRIRKKRMLLAVVSVIMGTLLITSMINIYTNIEKEMSKQLRAYGPNITVVPKGSDLKLEVGGVALETPSVVSYLNEEDIYKIKKIFWKYNIGDFTPVLNLKFDVKGDRIPAVGTYFNKTITVPGEAFKSVTTGMKNLYPWLEVEGRWIADDDFESAMIGKEVSKKYNLNTGGRLTAYYDGNPYSFTVKGVIRGGMAEENSIFIPLVKAQQIIGKPGSVSKIEVSSYITPDDDLAKKDVKSMNGKEYERWYCTPYIDSIAYQIEEVIHNGDAVPIAQIASAQGNLLRRITMMILFLTALTLIISTLGVMSNTTALVFERRKEIGIMMGVGAKSRQIIGIFAIEMMLIAVMGGMIGYIMGIGISYIVSNTVFNVTFSFDAYLIPVSIVSAVLITLTGSYIPIKGAVKINPVVVIRGE